MNKSHSSLTALHKIMFIFLLAALCSSLLMNMLAAPEGTTIISNTTEYAPISSAASSTTLGGSFTTLVLNTTTQTPRWKAYVGNVTGKFTLDDANSNTIYDWSALSFTGEVFASRSNSVSWSSIECSQDSLIVAEHTALNMTSLQVDNVNRTFNDTIHASFWVGTTFFSQSNCRAIATYLNNTRQTPDVNADFQVVLLDDTSNLVFAALLENDVLGFDNNPYDFQMIVPESDQQVTPQTYYFYTELG